MARKSKAIADFQAKYKVAEDELWEVHGSTWVVKHKALERIAVEVGIVWLRPSVQLCDLAAKTAVICAFGKLGEREEWSFGEASPANNKNSYPVAMAEKRARDRVILKLLVGSDLYSESEADEFEDRRQNPHVTRPADILPAAEYDENGEIIDNVPHATPARKLRVVDQRPIFEALQKEAHQFGESKKFIAWMNDQGVIDRVKDIKPDWQAMFRGLCKEHLEALRTQERGDDMRMAG
jgi:hypothetical protein